MRHPNRLWPAALVAAGLVGCLALSQTMSSHAQSRKSLNRSLSAAKSRAAVAKNRLTQARQRSKSAAEKVYELQGQLAAAEARLSRAKRKLKQTEDALVVIRKELTEALRRLSRHATFMRRRLLALYRQQDPSYVEVVLRSTSFADFANRARFTRVLCKQDEAALESLVQDRQRVQTQQAKLRKTQADLKQLQVKVQAEKKVVAARAQEAGAQRRKALDDEKEARATYEAELRESRAIEAMLTRVTAGRTRYRHESKWTGSLMRPVPGRISSPFGWRRHPVWGGRRFHNGIDLAIGSGTPIKCCAAGTVVFAGRKKVYGYTVMVDHGSGIQTMYAHCQRGSLQVRPGQKVSRGQTLARVDSTGVSTGNHLHWSVFKNGKAVNPATF